MKGVVVWFTGLPSSGKSTLAERVHQKLIQEGRCVCMMDSDAVRKALVPQPGYDSASRQSFYTTLANLAALLAEQGIVVLVPATAHRRAFREHARQVARRFIEVHVHAGPHEVRQRDAKGLYVAAEQGHVAGVPGVDVDYEPPLQAEVRATGGLEQTAPDRIVAAIDATIGGSAV